MCVYVCGCVSFLYRCFFTFCFVPCFSHVFFFLFFFFCCIRFCFYVFSPLFACLLLFFYSKDLFKGKKKTQRHDDNYDASRQVALKLTTEENKSK